MDSIRRTLEELVVKLNAIQQELQSIKGDLWVIEGRLVRYEMTAKQNIDQDMFDGMHDKDTEEEDEVFILANCNDFGLEAPIHSLRQRAERRRQVNICVSLFKACE